jgi:hypothetical protein
MNNDFEWAEKVLEGAGDVVGLVQLDLQNWQQCLAHSRCPGITCGMTEYPTRENWLNKWVKTGRKKL